MMLLMRNSVESSLTGVSPSASEDVISLWMCCCANSGSSSLERLAMGLQQFLKIGLINTSSPTSLASLTMFWMTPAS